jgi:hypothetical protein
MPKTAWHSGESFQLSLGSACDKGCSGEAGWGRATKTSGRKGSDEVIFGINSSPELCKLGQSHLLQDVVAQISSRSITRGNLCDR